MSEVRGLSYVKPRSASVLKNTPTPPISKPYS